MAYDFPASPTAGQEYTPSGGPTYVWQSPRWLVKTGAGVATTIGDTPPATPAVGQLWWESDTGNLYVWYVDADTSQWVQVNVAPLPPIVRTAETRNRIINPAMQISQENGLTGGSVNGYYTADQWQLFVNTIAAVSSSLFNIAPKTPGGSNSLVLAFSTAKPSLATSDYAGLLQNIEGVRVADLQWGTANAKQAVLSFAVYTPAGAEGTYSVAIRNPAYTRAWVGNYTTTTADVGKFVNRTLVIPGEPTGVWPKDTAKGLELIFTFAGGTGVTAPTAGWNTAGYIAGPGMSNGARVTGSFLLGDVGLYLDPNNTGVAPPWQMPDEAQELRACMRYWQKTRDNFYADVTNGWSYQTFMYLPASMRIGPAMSGVSLGNSSFAAAVGTLSVQNNALLSEARAANATGFGAFVSDITANARM